MAGSAWRGCRCGPLLDRSWSRSAGREVSQLELVEGPAGVVSVEGGGVLGAEEDGDADTDGDGDADAEGDGDPDRDSDGDGDGDLRGVADPDEGSGAADPNEGGGTATTDVNADGLTNPDTRGPWMMDGPIRC
jgi:hypothetical protein